MADGAAAFNFQGPAEGKSLLFPLQPQQGETLPGFILRSAEFNWLQGARSIRRMAGISPHDALIAWSQGVQDLERVGKSLGIFTEQVSDLWGATALVGGRRRLGGVWLRPKAIHASSRIVPTSMSGDTPDQAFWLVSDLGFCPNTWEILVRECPICNRPLSWSTTYALHLCQCGGEIAAAKKRMVTRGDRRVLEWLASLFSENDLVVERAMQALPAESLIRTATDAYEVISALARPMVLLRQGSKTCRKVTLEDVANSVRYLLEFPRSYWDLRQRDRCIRNDLMKRMEGQARFTTQTVVQQELLRMLRYGQHKGTASHFAGDAPLMSLTRVATALRAQKGDVRRLVNAGLLHDVDPCGGAHRAHSVFHRHEVERIKRGIDARLAWRDYKAIHALPAEALEQLFGQGSLIETDDAAARLLYEDRLLDRTTAELFANRLLENAPKDDEGTFVPLREVMMGVGGRPKPWGRLLLAGLSGELPGGFRQDPNYDGIGALRVHGLTARGLIMGGPNHAGAFRCLPGDLAGWQSLEMEPGEVVRYLNCEHEDLRTLKLWKRLTKINAKGMPTKFDRVQVEGIGRQLITTREIAARRGVAPTAMWVPLQRFAEDGSLGQGFYRRTLVEGWLADLGLDQV